MQAKRRKTREWWCIKEVLFNRNAFQFVEGRTIARNALRDTRQAKDEVMIGFI